MAWYPGIECEHGYDACPICDLPRNTRSGRVARDDQAVQEPVSSRAPDADATPGQSSE